MKTINDLMSEWQVEAAEDYAASCDMGVPITSGKTEAIYDEMVKTIGGKFELPENNFYHGLFIMLDAARNLKRAEAEVRYWYAELEKIAPEDYDIVEAEHRFYETYEERDNP